MGNGRDLFSRAGRAWLMAAVLPLAAYGCGGSSGGLPGGTLYAGGKGQVTLDATSGQEMASSAVSGPSTAMSFGNALKPGGTAGSGTTMQAMVSRVLGVALGVRGKARESGHITTLDCQDPLANPDGTITLTLTGPYSASVTFAACNLGNDTWANGTISMSSNAAGTAGTLVIDTLTIDDGLAGTIDIATNGGVGFSEVVDGVTGDTTETITINIDVNDNISGAQVRFDHYVLVSTTDDPTWAANTYGESSASGRIYLSDGAGIDGYVDISTQTPLYSVGPGEPFDDVAAVYPESGGPVFITGASGTSVRLTPAGDGTNVDIDVDVDGNGSYADPGDFSTTVAWNTL